MPAPFTLHALANLGFESSTQLVADVVAQGPLGTPAHIPGRFTGATQTPQLVGMYPLRLLHGLGKVTAAPDGISSMLLTLAGWWPVLRYAWAFDDPVPPDNRMRLVPATDRVRHHRRTVFSEDFGIAAAAFVLEEFLGATDILDADEDLNDLVAEGTLNHVASRRPDYLARPSQPGQPWLVADAKGTSADRGTVVSQLSDGCAQALSVSAATGTTRHVVVGALAPHAPYELLAAAIEVTPPAPNGIGLVSDDQDESLLAQDLGRAHRLAFAGAFAAAGRRARRELDSEEPPRTRVYAPEAAFEGVRFNIAARRWQLEAFFGLDARLSEVYQQAPSGEDVAAEREVRASLERVEGIPPSTDDERRVQNRYLMREPDEDVVRSVCTDGTLIELHFRETDGVDSTAS